MNGLNKANAPSLNGLSRSDGTSSVSSLNDATGRVILTSDDPGSFYFTEQGGDTVVLNTPFTTIQGTTDTLTTNMKFESSEVITNTLTTDRLIVGDVEFNPGTGGENPTWNDWSFQLHPDGHLNLMRGGRASFRFLASPVNLFSRVSQYDFTQKGGWSLSKGT